MSLLLGAEGQLKNLSQRLTSPFSARGRRSVNPADYVDGFVVEQLAGKKRKIALNGTNMPHQPFEYGGKSRRATQWYPGNSEPTIQMLGAEEKTVTIRGRFYSKKYTDTSLYAVPKALADTFRTMEREGELVKITLGEWRRWAVIADTNFKEKTKSDIEYEIQFEIISDKPPTNCYQLTDTKEETFQDNADMLAAAQELQANYSNQDTSVIDQSFADRLTTYVDEVASSVAAVNAFVNNALTQAENIEAAVTRALGLIKVARRNIANMIRRIGALSYAVTGSGNLARQFRSVSSASNAIADVSVIMAFLAKLQSQFEAIRKTLPKARYKVQSGDTLQRISIKYYGNPNSWDKIYDHNKLTSTDLTRGTVLEIPNL